LAQRRNASMTINSLKVSGRVLARLFTDYDPGIHWPQIQMRSGVAGMKTLRIYDPVKQQLDHDPTSRFVRKWVPALNNVPDSLLATPWLVATDERHGYPDPIVDHAAATSQAKRRIGAVRAQIRGDGSTLALLQRHIVRRPQSKGRRR